MDISRVAEGFRLLTAELYHEERAVTVPGDLVPVSLGFGPELLRYRWLERYFDRFMLRTIYAGMEGCEELYVQFYDLLNVQALQYEAVTPDEQTAGARRIAHQCGFTLHPTAIELLTLHEGEDAIKWLASVIAPEDSTTAFLEGLRQSVPLVLSTMKRVHTGWGIPTRLTPSRFVAWFHERLLLAAKVKLERFPHNPLWMAPDGSLRGLHLAADQDLQDFLAWRKHVSQPKSPGRPRGSGTYATTDEFFQTIRPIIQRLRHEGFYPSQQRVTDLWPRRITKRQFQRWASLYIPCSWQEFLEGEGE